MADLAPIEPPVTGREGGHFRRLRASSRLVLAAIFILAGVNHFRSPNEYERTIPPFLSAASALVVISGVAEIAGGVGILIPRLRWLAGWGLVALLVAVFPANIYMAMVPDRFMDLGVPTWALWARLPLQAVLIVWVWWSAIRRSAARVSGGPYVDSALAIAQAARSSG